MKVGARLRSTVCATTAVVVRAAAPDAVVECGGAPMAEGPGDPGTGTVAAGADGGTLLGKRYQDETTGLELLCTKSGAGGLSVDGRPLQLKAAKALPASD
jgi:hypothetical protein